LVRGERDGFLVASDGRKRRGANRIKVEEAATNNLEGEDEGKGTGQGRLWCAAVGLLCLLLHGSTAPPPPAYQEAEREGEGEGDDAKEKMGEQIWRKSTWICYRRWRRRRWRLERRRGDDGSKLAADELRAAACVREPLRS